MACSTVLGGGLGARRWVLNVEVPSAYARTDPQLHLAELARGCGLRGPGAGMLTAAAVAHFTRAADGGVGVVATTGLTAPTWAAAPAGKAERAEIDSARPGTINLIAAVPAAISDGALVNAIATATEAKTQALLEVGFACTGTASDAVCVAALVAAPVAAFAGPRSPWGARLARAVHRAVRDGALLWVETHPDKAAAAGLRPHSLGHAGAAAAELDRRQRCASRSEGYDNGHVDD
jgi:adenosylcobinamide amidohydrolase